MINMAASFPPGGGGLSPSQVKELLNSIDSEKMIQGRISPGSTRQVVPAVRSGTVQWLMPDEVGEEIFAHLYTLAVVANRERNWNFDIAGPAAALQATQYSAEGRQHYTWHMDWGVGPTRGRKIAAVAHLSDESDYEGGILQLANGPNAFKAHQLSGTVTVFPAFAMHRVTPVTRGVRRAVVAWILGPSFR
jgi:PKHD-type hydroxylase